MVAIGIITTINKKGKQAQTAGSGRNGGHGENFPFPKPFPFDNKPSESDDDDDEDWLGRRTVADEVVILEDRNANNNTPQQQALAREMAKVGSVTANKNAVAKANREEEPENEIFEFDARQAIIYSEILQPKFKEYEA